MNKRTANKPSARSHVRETGERTIHTYFALYDSARRSLRHAVEEPVGRAYFRMSAGVFAAFTAEAYFNDLGPRVFTFWKHLECLGPRQKAEVLRLQLSGAPVAWGSVLFRAWGRRSIFATASRTARPKPSLSNWYMKLEMLRTFLRSCRTAYERLGRNTATYRRLPIR